MAFCFAKLRIINNCEIYLAVLSNHQGRTGQIKEKVSPPVTLFFVLFKNQSSYKDYDAGTNGSYDHTSDKSFMDIKIQMAERA